MMYRAIPFRRRAVASLGITAVFLAACEGDVTSAKSPTAPDHAGAGAGAVLASKSPQAAHRVDVCHAVQSSRMYILLAVASSAVQAHLAHGDGLVGGGVSGRPGMVFDASCTPVAARRTLTTSGSWTGTMFLFNQLLTLSEGGPLDASVTVTGYTGTMRLALLGFSGGSCSTAFLPTPLPPGQGMPTPTISATWPYIPPGTYCLNVVTTEIVPPFPGPYSWTGTVLAP